MELANISGSSWSDGSRSSLPRSAGANQWLVEMMYVDPLLNDPPRSRRWSLKLTIVVALFPFKGSPKLVLTPLPDVAMEIEQTEIVGLEPADRLCSVG